jgi:hypothetical protein
MRSNGGHRVCGAEAAHMAELSHTAELYHSFEIFQTPPQLK